MDMKICKNCKLNQSIDNFIITARGVPHVRCKTCKASYEKEYYHKNKTKCKSIREKSSAKRFDKNMDYISSYLKSHSCIDCGESDIIVLDFDHRGNKEYSIADIRNNYCLDILKTEIEKCDVRCANCHRRKTAKERNYKKLSYV